MYSGYSNKKIKLYQVDAFTTKPFKGNPAAVCILDQPLEDFLLQSIAAEMNLSETAFVLPIQGSPNTFSLRWFTPKVEVPLCGHGTLAASQVLFEELKISASELIYHTKSGQLIAKKTDEGIVLDFPADEPLEASVPPELLKAVGIQDYIKAIYGKATKKLVLELATVEEIISLQPDFEQMKNISFAMDIKGLGITASSGSNFDFVSRYFNPWAGVNEDSVTGSVHTLLAAYWWNILHKDELRAYQASERGGEMLLKLRDGSRIDMIGNAVIVFKGELFTHDFL